jgi:hypothetical protein
MVKGVSGLSGTFASVFEPLAGRGWVGKRKICDCERPSDFICGLGTGAHDSPPDRLGTLVESVTASADAGILS